jgi:prolipoprotein diacylglyceryltransferase
VPVQLISAALLAGAGILLVAVSYLKLKRGTLFALSAVLYSAGRFMMDLWCDDPRLFLWGLSDGQWFSIAYGALGMGVLGYASGSRKKS